MNNTFIPFWFPPKPKHLYKLSSVPESYKCQVKKDGHRAIIMHDARGFQMLNRFGTPLQCLKTTTAYAEAIFKEIFGKGFYHDGEGLGIRQKGDTTDTIIIWDELYENYTSLQALTYQKRQEMLFRHTNLKKPTSAKGFGCFVIFESPELNIYMSQTYDKESTHWLWPKLDNRYDEGLVYKNMQSTIRFSLSATEKTPDMLKLKIVDNPQL